MLENKIEFIKGNMLSLNNDDINEHSFIFASAGRGKSVFLMREALRRGIPYEDLIKELEPTEEQKAALKEKETKQKTAQRNRFEAVRKAYWENSSPDDFDFLTLDNCVSSLLPELGEINNNQRAALFMSLPEDIVYSAMHHGISDSVVTDDIYLYIKNNVDEIAKILNNKM